MHVLVSFQWIRALHAPTISNEEGQEAAEERGFR